MNINNQISPSLSQQFHQSVTRQTVTSPTTSLKQPFISRVQRFDSQASNTPGPGAYNPLITEKHTIDFKKKINDDSSDNKKFAWIYDKSRMSFALANSSQSKLGPGEYDEPKSVKLHSSWAKGQRFDSAPKFESLGPGYYQQTSKQKHRQRQLSVFKSKSPKTFIQEMIMKTKKKVQQSSNSPEQNHKQLQEVVKFQQNQYPIKPIIANKNSPVFLSKAKRPEIILENASPHLGPGVYEIETQSSPYMSKTKGLISAIHYNLSPIKSKPQVQSKRLPPGPGSYEIDSSKLQKLTKKQPLGIIFKQERFKAHSLTSDVPGPGQYNQNRFTMLKEDEVLLRNKGSFIRKSEATHNFGTAARTTLRKKIDIPFGQYNVKNFDIQYKIQKQKQHYDKLRLMEVTLPAFNTKHHL